MALRRPVDGGKRRHVFLVEIDASKQLHPSNLSGLSKGSFTVAKGSCTQAIWVGDFAERCDFKIEKSVSNRNHQRQVFIVFTPV